MDVLAWIVFGLIAGAIAKAILPGSDPGGAIVTILIGIVGSLLGGFIGRALLGYGRVNEAGTHVSRPGFLMNLILAVIGSIILLVGYRLIRGRSLTS
ncbi:MAG: GlsB/YeaQ/YmgE family stress response membrane protein [Blastocatellia bacterium]|nr:GlsB/YeaQ/YmgE family stress response membrane protein [Blastocatellia bacterium]MBO0799108.1 GlsB/YeaQ/YmgE family stress response membrane protein [Blastocatellia bacterium]